MSFNLNSLALHDSFVLQLKHPVEGTPLFADEAETEAVSITLYGTSSKQYRNAVTAMQNRQLRRNAKKERASAEDLKEESISLLVACSATSAFLSLDDKPVTDAATFRQLYSDARFSWVKDQVDEALADTSNFLEQ